MLITPPRIDQRDQQKVAEQLRELLLDEKYCAREWKDQKSIQEDKNADAVIQVFSRMMELIIQRLNKVPEKNFLTFLDMVGTRLSPPRVARAPLTFTMAKGKTMDGKIPKGTQVATVQTKELPALVFETESDITVIQSELKKAVSLSPGEDMWTDHSGALFDSVKKEVELFRGINLVPHRLYIGHSRLFGFKEKTTIKLEITLDKEVTMGVPWEVQWYCYTEGISEPKALAPREDTAVTKLLKSGNIIFDNVSGILEKELVGIENGKQNNWKSRWIFAGLNTPIPKDELPIIKTIKASIVITPALSDGTGTISSNNKVVTGMGTKFTEELKKGDSITVDTQTRLVTAIESDTSLTIDYAFSSGLSDKKFTHTALPFPDLAFFNNIPLDLTKDFYPFGEKPKFNDTVYIGSKEVFSKAGAAISVMVVLSDGVYPPNTENITLSWEFWDGNNWMKIGDTNQRCAGNPAGFTDLTCAFKRNGTVTFNCPNIKEKEINGEKNYWIRVRITKGDYGKEATYEETITDAGEGTGTITSTGRIVRGAGTDFSKKLKVGDLITAANQTRTVTSVDSDISLTIDSAFESDIIAATTFTIKKTGWIYKPPTFKPPSISTLTLKYILESQLEDPDLVLSYNDFIYKNQTRNPNYFPFQPVTDTDHALYLAFNQDIATLPVTLFFPLLENPFSAVIPLAFAHKGPGQHSLSVELKYISSMQEGDVVEFRNPAGETEKKRITGIDGSTISWKDKLTRDFSADKSTVSLSPADNPPVLAWEYWNGKSWSLLRVDDKTRNLTKRELIQFPAPSDIKKRYCFEEEKEYYWIRARLDKGRYESFPKLRGIYTNTIWVNNLITVKDETLGSSNGKTSQVFNLSHSPVLPGQKIRVREHSLTEKERKTTIIEEKTEDAIEDIPDEAGNIIGYWIRWHEVSHFYSSGPHSRHYVIDRIKGTITFGDGERGMIPPPGKNNIVSNHYQYGGGSNGNYAGEKTIKKLRTAFPFIETVTNYEGADGGGDEETLERAKVRGPQTFKHRERAVTYEDFKWLVEASPKVAKAKCLPTTHPSKKFKCGWITIIIVPDERENEKPVPTQGLINEIERDIFSKSSSYLTDLSQISLIGPGYIQVRVEAQVHFNYIADAKIIEGRIIKRLNDFFHPLKGRPNGKGWDFGEHVYISEVYEVIEGTEGVDYVEKLYLKASIQIYKLNLETGFMPEVSYQKNSRVAISGGSIVFFLAEKIEEEKIIASLTVLGFKEGDQVTISNSKGDYFTTVVLKSVSGDLLECETNTPDITVPSGSIVETSDGIKSYTIHDSAQKPDKDKVIRLTVAIFEAGNEIVLIHKDIPEKSIGLVQAVSDHVETVYVEDNYLVYSGVHSINK